MVLLSSKTTITSLLDKSYLEPWPFSNVLTSIRLGFAVAVDIVFAWSRVVAEEDHPLFIKSRIKLTSSIDQFLHY